jgi:CDP-diacylglycerol---serine O-phosphatidyltransferase
VTPRYSPEETDARQVRRAARVRRGMFVLPSLFTAGSIGAGYFAITQTIDSVSSANAAQHLDWAAIAICLAIPFDALDGRIARMTNTTSDFGRELDSLADAVTFGVAPALLALIWGYHLLPEAMNPELRRPLLQIGSFVCFMFLLCGASRLARFNSSHDAQPRNPGRLDRKYFVGMPIPAAAGLIAATVHCFYGYPIPYWWLAALWTALVALLSFLMVSTWRFWSGKEINLSRTQPFQLLALLAIGLFILIRFSRGAVFFLMLAYMFSGIWARAAYSWQRRRRRRQIPAAAETDARFTPQFRAHESQDFENDDYAGSYPYAPASNGQHSEQFPDRQEQEFEPHDRGDRS